MKEINYKEHEKKKNILIQGAGWNSSTLLGTGKPQEGSSVQF